MSEVTQNPSVILSLQQVDIPAMVGEIPGSPDTAAISLAT